MKLPKPLRSAIRRYRATGADLPFGDPGRRHGVAMEGYFWRITDRAKNRSLIALIGVNKSDEGPWATLGVGSYPNNFLRTVEYPSASASTLTTAAWAGGVFFGDGERLTVDLAEDCRLDLRFDDVVGWPEKAFGGSSVFQTIPGLNQYWHPWILGGKASGIAQIGSQLWELDGAEIYAEKNWGREGFPDEWWWGQAQGFGDGACVAFAGGKVKAGLLSTEVTALVVRFPDGKLLRLGDPIMTPVKATVTDDHWRLFGRGYGYTVEVDASAPLSHAHVLPVPLPTERRNTAGALEHLGGALSITVKKGKTVVWEGRSVLAGLEHGGLARAEAELRRRGVAEGAVDAPPL